ncbi:cardiolipin synthase (CMP-forming)-like isoform X2 [Limulus polyphemus]|uniref:cardiolipin synthase (CMP-forming) n=1 Tax=Limulus polyphemus TaxID=6850 RepID=A0ABM1TJ45_LIMPO|nr:cardiolipin synthase (CMP-forming)-like isoform X2 [Limulus polyphemus]
MTNFFANVIHPVKLFSQFNFFRFCPYQVLCSSNAVRSLSSFYRSIPNNINLLYVPISRVRPWTAFGWTFSEMSLCKSCVKFNSASATNCFSSKLCGFGKHFSTDRETFAKRSSSRQNPKEESQDITVTLTGSSKLRLPRTRHRFLETRKKVSKRMVEIENVMTIPNGLCLLRIGATPLLGYLILVGNYEASFGLFAAAGVTDMLDGYIARKFPSQQSVIGSFLDPMADKFLIATLFITLTIAELLPVPLTTLIVARDVCLVTAGFYIRYQSLPSPRTLSRYFDVTLPTAKLSPTFISKVNTAIQFSLVAFTLAAPVFGYVDHPYMKLLWYLTAVTTVSSGVSYMFSKNTYKFLKSRSPKNV